MPTVVCPSCGEKGRVPNHFIGIRIKCKTCGKSFLVTHPAEGPSQPVDEAVAHSSPDSHPEGIEVPGLDTGPWDAVQDSPAEDTAEHIPVAKHDPAHDETSEAFTAHEGDSPGARQYKVLTQKDKWFDGKFDLARLEEALNHYVCQGWVVRSMATPQVVSFLGGTREELVILLER